MRTFESLPMHSSMPRWSTRATGRNPSPRFASVVGHTQMRPPAAASRSSSCPSACVACTSVVRGEAACVVEQLDRPHPVSAMHSSISRGCSSACTWSGKSWAAAYAPSSRSASGGHARTEWGAIPTRMPRHGAPRPAAGSPRPTPDGSGRCRRGDNRRTAARTRSRPGQRPRPPRGLHRARGSGTRRPR